MAVSRALLATVTPEPADVVDLALVRQAQEQQRTPPPRYSPTTSLEKIERSGARPEDVLKLDWNEGTIAPPPSVAEAVVRHVLDAGGNYLKWYPALEGGNPLKAELARYCGTAEDNLLVTNGSDDALVVLCHAFLGPGKTALAPTPTYEHFCVDVMATGATLVRLDLSDPFVADVELVEAGIVRHRPELVYLVSPNNPTGIHWPTEAVRDLADRFPSVLFIVDEAYHEFAQIDPATGRRVTCAELATTRRNVVVTRTFSKAFCLASVRCGYIIGHPTTLDELRPYYNPKSVNQFAQVAALAALRERDSYYQPYIDGVHRARAAFVRDLEARGVTVRTGGAGNFVCVYVPDGRTAELCRRLEEDDIYVRDLGIRFPGHVRVTVGLEMDKVAAAIGRILDEMDS